MGAMTDDLLKLLDDAGTVLACAAGNDDDVPTKYLAVFRNPAHDKGERNKHIANVVVVAASKPETHKAKFSNYADWITTFAPGEKVWVPHIDTFKGNGPAYIGSEGTSYGKWAKTKDKQAMVMPRPGGDYS